MLLKKTVNFRTVYMTDLFVKEEFRRQGATHNLFAGLAYQFEKGQNFAGCVIGWNLLAIQYYKTRKLNNRPQLSLSNISF